MLKRILLPLSLLCLGSAFLSAPLSAQETAAPPAVPALHSAINPVPRPEEGPKKRYELLNQRAKDNPDAQLVFLGDSITQGWEGAGRKAWATYYGHRKALNIGIGGDRTQHVLWRLDNGNIDGLKPKLVVLMIGTNNSNREDNTPGEIVEGVTAIVKKLREKLPGAKVLVVGIFPRGQTFSAQRGKILQVNQAIQKLADGQSVHYLDFGYQLIEADGSIAKNIMPDYLHLSEKGYGIWAEAIEDKVSSLLGDQRVPAPVAANAPDPSGEWTWKIRGPNGEDVEAGMVLKAENGRLTGRFARDTDRWMEVEKGTIRGNELSFLLRRDRPNGGEMVYGMSATIEGNAIQGTAKTEMDGQEVTAPWSARRK